MSILLALILTILVEFIVYCLFIQKKFLSLLAYSVLINSITNPLMNLALGLGLNIILLEFLVFVAEIFLIKSLLSLNYKKAALISFVANIISFLLGVLIFGVV
jgi:hypothetical protein